jgi:HSP20 family protein
MKTIQYNYPKLAFGNDFRRLLRDAFEGFDGLGNLFERPARPANAPAADLYSSDEAYHVRVEVPGVRKEEVSVSLENSVLKIRATHEEGEGEARRVLNFDRSLAVPDDVDAEKIEAKLENGVLSITLTKQEAQKPKQIAIL